MKLFFKEMLKVSAFYIKKHFLGHSQYKNKKALFTDPIFSEGFDHRDAWVHGTADALAGTAAMIEIMTAMSKTMRVCIVFELAPFFHTKFYRL